MTKADDTKTPDAARKKGMKEVVFSNAELDGSAASPAGRSGTSGLQNDAKGCAGP
ncbi:MAG: hypothetical protein U1E97_01000 [Alphaproteobacteria bacterium]